MLTHKQATKHGKIINDKVIFHKLYIIYINICVQGVLLTLCCSMASKALNSKGSKYVAKLPSPANCGPSSNTSHFSRPNPRKSSTSKHSGVTTALRD